MAKHTLDYADLSEIKFEHEIASACGPNYRKSLVVCVHRGSASFVVKNKDGVIASKTGTLMEAVNLYNEI